MTSPDRRLVVGITGASGAAYAIRFLQAATGSFDEIYVALSEQAAQVIGLETGRSIDFHKPTAAALIGFDCPAIQFLHSKNYFSPPASGSFRHAGMVIVPCSMGTAGRIAAGISNDLITRAADVCLKERRKLILVPRETPWSLIHLRTMTALAEAGATILPACPGFYHRPQTVQEVVDHVVARILHQLGIDQSLVPEWQHESE